MNRGLGNTIPLFPFKDGNMIINPELSSREYSLRGKLNRTEAILEHPMHVKLIMLMSEFSRRENSTTPSDVEWCSWAQERIAYLKSKESWVK